MGATGHDGDSATMRSGAVYVFERQAPGWVESQRLLPSRPIENGVLGNAISVDGDWLAVGAFFDSHAGRGVANRSARSQNPVPSQVCRFESDLGYRTLDFSGREFSEPGS